MKCKSLKFALGLSLLAAAASSPANEALNGLAKIGPFAPGMTAIEAMTAAPDYNWNPVYHDHSYVVTGAYSELALEYIGAKWNVAIGNQSGGNRMDEIASIDLKRDFDFKSRRECKAAYDNIIAHMEKDFGPFGLHPDLSNPRSTLYGDPFSEGFKIKKITKLSKGRVYPKMLGGTREYSTFREPLDGEFYRIMVNATSFDDFKSCDLRINIFIAYEYSGGADVIPVGLEAKYPGRYRKKENR